MSTNIERAAEVIARQQDSHGPYSPHTVAEALAAEGLLVTDAERALIEAVVVYEQAPRGKDSNRLYHAYRTAAAKVLAERES